MNLAEGFIRLLENRPELTARVRLVMIGDGPLREPAMRRLAEAGYGDLVWVPGSRNDVEAILPAFDLFVLPSLAEGISNTLLEAMACGLPVLATAVGGNPELVTDGESGTLIPAADSDAMATMLERYVRDKALRLSQGKAGRKRVEEKFSITAMVDSYVRLYDNLGVTVR
jgi:glycosyltransferase involved in cell wall biosynthesis